MTNDLRQQPFELQGYTFEPVGEWGYMPTRPTGFYGLSSDTPMEVVGESRYHDGISRIVTRWRADGSGEGEIIALLFAEPGNPFDQNAVRVLLCYEDLHTTCGYLPKEQARIFAPAVKREADNGLIVALHARAFGGTREKPNIGVWLGLPSGRYDENGNLPAD